MYLKSPCIQNTDISTKHLKLIHTNFGPQLLSLYSVWRDNITVICIFSPQKMPMYLNVLNNMLGMKKKKVPENLISVFNNVQVNWVREDERLLLTVSQTISGSPFEFSCVNKKDKTGQSFNINVKQWLNCLRNYQMSKISTFFLSMKLLKALILSNKTRFV